MIERDGIRVTEEIAKSLWLPMTAAINKSHQECVGSRCMAFIRDGQEWDAESQDWVPMFRCGMIKR